MTKQSFYKLTLYVPIEFEDITRSFVENCKLTDHSASQRVMDFIKDELENMETTQKNMKLVCEICKKDFVEGALTRFVSGARLLVCANCLKIRYDKGLVRGILKEFKGEEEHFNPNLYGAK